MNEKTDRMDPERIHLSETFEGVTEHQVTVADELPHGRAHHALASPLETVIEKIGHLICWANGILVVVIITQVLLRYGFGKGLVVLEELQWHLYAIAVMFGVSYAMVHDSHIRVDVLHMRLSERTHHIVEIFGILFLLAPFLFVVVDHGYDFFADSFRLNERSDAPTGLPWRWAIKAVIPLSFALSASSFVVSVTTPTSISTRAPASTI